MPKKLYPVELKKNRKILVAGICDSRTKIGRLHQVGEVLSSEGLEAFFREPPLTGFQRFPFGIASGTLEL